MRLSNNLHLTYCTNIHPGENWEITFANLKKYVPLIKNAVSDDESFGLGLRLSNKASEELATNNNLDVFKKWLKENNVYIFTMNGFPYGNFHNERVKDLVHAPDWTTEERITYTKRLADQLAQLLPENISGGISTSPISYKHWHPSFVDKRTAFKTGAKNLAKIILHLFEIENRTGKYVHLDIEPEPDGLIENSDELIEFFNLYLKPIAKDYLEQRIAANEQLAEQLIYKYITVCYDVCHFSLAYEEPENTLKMFASEGIKVGKIQVSSALKILSNGGDNKKIWESLSKFNESTYLHQVTELVDGKVKTYNDLPVVLENKKDFSELRAHFHVPIFLEEFDGLYSTQDQILNVVNYLQNENISEHLEIETYTWDVLPENLKTDLSSSIIREIDWLKNKLQKTI
tara:strand:+ start:1853 stop:3058 length:1206 start_codon:yes stop_codon:yes gene_type:complete